jgi:hypothetical protein
MNAPATGRAGRYYTDYSLRQVQAPAFNGGHELRGQLRVLYPADLQEALSSVEDLWLRMARHSAVHSAVVRDTVTGEQLVLFRTLREDMKFQGSAEGLSGDARALMADAACRDSYAWSQDGSRGNLTSKIQWIGDTLMIELSQFDAIRRWPEGEVVLWSMQSLLSRVRRRASDRA